MSSSSRAMISVIVCTTAAALATPAAARAHALVDEGRRAYEEADFAAAIDAFSRAEGIPDLTREDVVELLEGQALAHYALSELDAVRQAIERLASVDPTHRLPEESPPELLEMFDEAVRAAGEGIELTVDAVRDGETARLTPMLEGDHFGLVGSLSIAARGGGAWQRGDESGLTIEASGPVEYYAEAISSSGAPIARVGSEADPEILQGSDGASNDDVVLWGLVGGGAALAIVVIVIAGVVAASQGQETLPVPIGRPTLRD